MATSLFRLSFAAGINEKGRYFSVKVKKYW